MTYSESTARTSKLFCSDCGIKIPQGMSVVFELNGGGRMKNVYCSKCKDDYTDEADSDCDDGLDHLFDCGSR